MSTSVKRLAATGLGIGLLAVASASAQAPPAPLALVTPTTPATLSFSGGVARLTVVVANNSAKPRPLSVRYVGAGAPAAGLAAERKASGAALELVVAGPDTVAAHDAAVLRLAFHRAAAEPALDGALVVRAGDAAVAVAVSEGQAPDTAGFKQKSASITTTSLVGPVARVCRVFGFIDHCPPDHYWRRSTTVAATGVVDHDTLIGASSGDNATVSLAPPAGGGQPRSQRQSSASAPAPQAPTATQTQPTLATITATDIPNPGTYSGDVAVDPAAAEPKTIGVTVHARDAIWWPLLAVAVGLLLSWLLIKRRDPKRSAEGLRLALRQAVAPYLTKSVEREERRPDRDYLDDLFIKTRTGHPAPEARQFVGPEDARTAPTAEVPKLYWDTFNIDDADARADVQKRVTAIIARFGRWRRLDDAYTALAQAGERLPKTDPVYDHAQSVLDLAQGEPVDDDETAARAAAMTAWALICALYDQVNERFAVAERKQGARWAQEHESLKAQEIYAHFAPADTPDKVAALRLALLRARRLLVDPTTAPKDDPHRSIVENLREASADTAGIEISLDDILGPGVFSHLVSPLRHHLPTTDEVRRRVREWDWIVFVAVSLLTLLAYTLGFYAGKDWGSLTDYLTAIVAGATVPTVINWALLPSERTLTTTASASSS